MTVVIRLLGAFEVTVDGEPVAAAAWRRRSASGLVKLLALQRDRRLRREQVIDALWPDLLLDEAAPRLHQAAHYARKALGGSEAVVLAEDRVALLPAEQVLVDVADFETAADAADDDPSWAANAAGRYTGDLLPDDLFEPWTEDLRDRLRLRHRELLRAAGSWAALAAADPLDEEAQVALAREHLEQGRRLALRRLDQLAGALRRELGIAPGGAAVALRARVLALPTNPRASAERELAACCR
jgi:DNA-binding SARP family transcriptional activator